MVRFQKYLDKHFCKKDLSRSEEGIVLLSRWKYVTFLTVKISFSSHGENLFLPFQIESMRTNAQRMNLGRVSLWIWRNFGSKISVIQSARDDVNLASTYAPFVKSKELLPVDRGKIGGWHLLRDDPAVGKLYLQLLFSKETLQTLNEVCGCRTNFLP